MVSVGQIYVFDRSNEKIQRKVFLRINKIVTVNGRGKKIIHIGMKPVEYVWESIQVAALDEMLRTFK